MLTAIYWLFAIETALIPSLSNYAHGQEIVRYKNEPLSSVTFEAEIGTTLGPAQLFIAGSTRSTQLYREGITFDPILQRYDVGIGVRYKNIEFGARHFCEHPVVPHGGAAKAPVDLARREIYARIEFGGTR